MKKETKSNKLVFTNVVIIEDSHGKLGKSIRVMEQHMYTELMSIQDIEEWEDKLIESGIPYVLAQVETTLPNPVRYARGYALFVHGGSV